MTMEQKVEVKVLKDINTIKTAINKMQLIINRMNKKMVRLEADNITLKGELSNIKKTLKQ